MQGFGRKPIKSNYDKRFESIHKPSSLGTQFQCKKLRKSKLSSLSSSQNSIPHVSPVEVRKTLEDMIETENELHSNSSVFSDVDSSRTETVVRLLEEAIKDIQNRRNYKEVGAANITNDVIINGSLNQISQKFTLNERQDIAFKIARSHLLKSFRRSMLMLDPGKALRMHISGEAGTGKSRVVEALKYLAASWGRPDVYQP